MTAFAPLASAAPKRDKSDKAAEAEAERLEVARQHFLRGEALEKEGKLEEAIIEYDMSEMSHPSPSVAETKARLRERIAARVVTTPTVVIAAAPPVEPHRPLSRFVAPIVIAPIALGALVAGAAVIGTEKHDYDHLKGSCAPGCAPSDVNPLKTRETVGYALIGVGAGLAAVDIALWAVLAKRHDRPRDVAFEPSLTGLRGRF